MQNYLYESKIKIYQILKSLIDTGRNTRGWAWWKSSSGGNSRQLKGTVCFVGDAEEVTDGVGGKRV